MRVRAAPCKYFPDVETVLLARHARQIGEHLDQLAEVRGQADEPVGRPEAVLEAFAPVSHASRGHRDTEVAAFLHKDRHVSEARQQLHGMIRDLAAEGVRTGDLRNDIAPASSRATRLWAWTS
ncbi:hypothetical protein [Streptomyces sp. NPDC090798]|uniref:hypothetical protein n=1 Tax=Streptomyces sp. NPDC090798 TaxID=3365968 RepID=UPI003823934E